MAAQTLRVRTRVLPGRKIEVPTPTLPEGVEVGVAITVASASRRRSPAQMMRERPPFDTPQAVESWEQYEQLLQQERDGWER